MVIPEVPTSFVTPSHYGSEGSASYDSLPLPLDVYPTREPEPSTSYTLAPQPLSLGRPSDYFSDSLAVALNTYEEASAHIESYSATLPTPHAERAGPCRTQITRKRSFPAPYQSVTTNGGSRSAGVGLGDPPRQRPMHPWENAPGFASAPELQLAYEVSSQTSLSEPSSIDPPLPGSFDGYLHNTALSVYEEGQQPSTQPYMTLISEQQSTPFNQHLCYHLEDGRLLQPIAPYPVGVSSSPSSSSSASGAASLPTTSSFGSSSPSRAPLPPSQLGADAFLENGGINLHIQGDYATRTYPTYSTTDSHGSGILLSMDTTGQPMDIALAPMDDALEHAHSYASWTYLYAPQ
ncbi:hypothetical protein FS837_003929 [Tulasnella sp. UAMH 9824]|nr:hypothetical protein FS837_003929 [Tulasnella sp. UAMH 9824]